MRSGSPRPARLPGSLCAALAVLLVASALVTTCEGVRAQARNKATEATPPTPSDPTDAATSNAASTFAGERRAAVEETAPGEDEGAPLTPTASASRSKASGVPAAVNGTAKSTRRSGTSAARNGTAGGTAARNGTTGTARGNSTSATRPKGTKGGSVRARKTAEDVAKAPESSTPHAPPSAEGSLTRDTEGQQASLSADDAPPAKTAPPAALVSPSDGDLHTAESANESGPPVRGKERVSAADEAVGESVSGGTEGISEAVAQSASTPQFPPKVPSAVVVRRSGTVAAVDDVAPLLYVETLDGSMHAVDSGTGEVRWSLNLGPLLRSSPVTPSPHDRFFIPSPRDGVIYVYDPQDRHLSRFPLTIPELVKLSPFRSKEDGNLYVGHKTTGIIAIDPVAGRVAKQFHPGADDDTLLEEALPANTVFVGRTVYDLSVHFRDPSRPRWHVSYAQYVPSVSHLGDHRRVRSLGNTLFFAGVVNGTLSARDAHTGDLRWTVPLNAAPVALFAVQEDRVARLAFVPLLTDVEDDDPHIGSDAFVRAYFGGDGLTLPPTLRPHLMIGVHGGALYAQLVLQRAADASGVRTSDGMPVIGAGVGRIAGPAGDSEGRTVTDLAVVASNVGALHYDSLTCDRLALPCGSDAGLHACEPGAPDFPFCLAGVHEVPSVSPGRVELPVDGGGTIVPDIQGPIVIPSRESEGSGTAAERSIGWSLESAVAFVLSTGGAAVAGTIAAVAVGLVITRRRVVATGEPPQGPQQPSAVESISPPPATEALVSPKSRKKKGKKKAQKAIGAGGMQDAPDISDGEDAPEDRAAKQPQARIEAEDAQPPPTPKSPSVGELGPPPPLVDNPSEGGSRGQVPVQLLSGGNFSELVHNSDGTYSIGRLRVTGEVLGHGCHGTIVLRGDYEGRPVAVKRMLSEYFELAAREIDLLQTADMHPHVVRYYCRERDARFLYIGLELCKMTLVQWVEAKSTGSPAQRSALLFPQARHPVDARRLLQEVMDGLAHLHSIGIVHRDLKPQNVLLTAKGRALISDFGLCKLLVDGQSSYQTNVVAGTIGWTAPEMLRTAGRMTRAVDIFSAGCLVFYAATDGLHPFGEHFERELNIRNGKANLAPIADDPEGLDLVRSMLSDDASARPSAQAALLHPFFWSPARRLHFLMEFSDRIEKEDATSPLVTALEHAGASIVGADWRQRLEPELLADMGKFRKYNWASVRDLLRAMRNKKHHFRELPEPLRLTLGEVPDGFYAYFNSRFPTLLMRAYDIVRRGPCQKEPMFEPYFAPGHPHA